MAELSIRLRRASPGLLSLPWLDPLEAWRPDEADLRQIQVGPSRHTVRFVQADGVLYALKELPTRTAVKEYGVLRDLEARYCQRWRRWAWSSSRRPATASWSRSSSPDRGST